MKTALVCIFSLLTFCFMSPDLMALDRGDRDAGPRAIPGRYPPSAVGPGTFSKFISALPPGMERDGFMMERADLSLFTNHSTNADGIVDTVSVITAVTDEVWDTVVNTWVGNSRNLYSYDGRAKLTEAIFQMWVMIQWQDIQKSNFCYDVNGRILQEVALNNLGGIWQKSHQLQYSYGANGLVSAYTLQLWNGSSWQNSVCNSYTYDLANRVTRVVEESWNGTSWSDHLDYTASYDGSGHLTQIVSRRWEEGEWKNLDRTEYAYVDGQPTVEIEQYWSGGAWVNETRYLSVYEGDDIVEYTRQDWQYSEWTNETRTTYIYDMYGNVTDEYGDVWNLADWAWDYVTFYTYNADNDVVESSTQKWDGDEWINSEKVTYDRGKIVMPATVTQHYDVMEKWNMVSVPLTVTTNEKNSIFPTSVSSAFSFDAGYTACPMLEYGRGYWLKFDAAQTIPVSGSIRTEDTVDVVAGWNMVGSIGVPIPAEAVGSIPGGLITSNFFTFTGVYTPTATLAPGKGHWVKVSEPGKLVFSSAGAMPAEARIRMELTGVQPPPPPEDPVAVADYPEYRLEQNFPNPFNPVTEIRYSVAEAGHVRLSVYNVIGQEVALLVDEVQEAGPHSVAFKAERYPTGVYFCRMTAGDFSGLKRMVFLR